MHNDPPLSAHQAPFALHTPPDGQPAVPVLVCSPHSGRVYPEAFVAASRLSAADLRLSEDALMDTLVADACRAGMTLLTAEYPRAYVDLNREPWELDPRMFDEDLPAHVNTSSPRARAGLGTVARLVACGKEIYAAHLKFSDVRRRIEEIYQPYHAAMAEQSGLLRSAFGACVIIDAHSMPSSGLSQSRGNKHKKDRLPDIVLGDRHGRSCDPMITALLTHYFEAAGLAVALNVPYAGAFTLDRYGQPHAGLHAVQIEVRRDLYMNESTLVPSKGFDGIRTVFAGLFDHLAQQLGHSDMIGQLTPRLVAE